MTHRGKWATVVMIVSFLVFGIVGWLGVFTDVLDIEARDSIRAAVLSAAMMLVGLPVTVGWIRFR